MRTSCASVGMCSRCPALQRVVLRCNALSCVATCCPALQRVVLRCNALSCVATRCPARWMACRSSSARSCSGTTATPRSGCRHAGDAAVRPLAFRARTRACTAPTHEHVRTLACAHRPSHAHARCRCGCGCADGLGVPAVPDAAAAVAALGARTKVRTRQSHPPTAAQRCARAAQLRVIRVLLLRALSLRHVSARARSPSARLSVLSWRVGHWQRLRSTSHLPPQERGARSTQEYGSGVWGTVSTQGTANPYPRQVRAERGARSTQEYGVL
jgi:hypothetical protein